VICPDTNVVISALNGRPPQAAVRLDAELARGTRILIPAVVIFELRYGVAKSNRAAKSAAVLDKFLSSRFELAAFDPGDADEAADIHAYLERNGTPIGPYDIFIAAQARWRGAAQVTSNRREFERVPGLMVQDWGA
jgi:tRNA(fMet)-specific endonuclease VapC